MLFYVTLCYAMLRYVTLCYVTLRYVKLRYVMFHFTMVIGSPDSFGKMFVYPSMALVASDFTNILIVGNDGMDGDMGKLFVCVKHTSEALYFCNFDIVTLLSGFIK